MPQLSFFASAHSAEEDDIPGILTLPDDIQAGDVIIIEEKCSNPNVDNGQIGYNQPLDNKVPYGFERIHPTVCQAPLLTHCNSWFWKIADGSEGGTVLNDLPGGVTTGGHANRRLALVIRGTRPITGFDITPVAPSYSNDDPDAITLNPVGQCVAVALVSTMGGRSESRSYSIPPHIEETIPLQIYDGGHSIFAAGWVFNANPPEAIVIDKGDDGTWNVLFGAIFHNFTFAQEPVVSEVEITSEGVLVAEQSGSGPVGMTNTDASFTVIAPGTLSVEQIGAGEVKITHTPLSGGGGEETLITSGSLVGDVTGGAGLAGCADGVTSKAASACSQKNNSTSCYWGRDFTGSPKKVSRVKVYSANNRGYKGNEAPNVTVTLRRPDGGSLGSISFVDTENESAGREIVCNDPNTAFNGIVKVEVVTNGSASSAVNLAQVEMIGVN